MSNYMTAVMSNQNIDRNALLGYMVFYYMSDIRLKQVELEGIFNKNMMPAGYLPQKIFGHDAFRRVTGKIRGSVGINVNGAQQTAKLNIDEVRNDNDEIVRAVGRKIIDTQTESVAYETVGMLIYDKASEDVTYSMISGFESEFDYETNYMIPTLTAYTDAMVYHNSDTVRTIVNRVLQAQNPVTIIKGAYFIPKTHEGEMMALKGVITDLANYANQAKDLPDMRIIPLLDTVEQRDLITRKASNEFARELDDITVELTEVLVSNKELKDITLLRLNNTFQALRDRTNEYSALLNIKLSNTEALFTRALELFTQAKQIPAMTGFNPAEAGLAG